MSTNQCKTSLIFLTFHFFNAGQLLIWIALAGQLGNLSTVSSNKEIQPRRQEYEYCQSGCNINPYSAEFVKIYKLL